jgi:uncharacterized membrane protein
VRDALAAHRAGRLRLTRPTEEAALFFFLNGFFAPPPGATIPLNVFTGVLRA